MAKGFRELEGITADLGLEAWGETVQEAFMSAAEGLASLLGSIPAEKLGRTMHISVHGEDLPSLLVRFLNEMIYMEETRDLIPGKIQKLWISGHSLFAVFKCAEGSTVDPAERTSVKAATYHDLEINQSKRGVRIRVILDV